MLLAIDSGNTNTVFAVFSTDGKIVSQWRASSDVDRTADEIGVWLDRLMILDNIDRAGITEAIIATVVPANLFNLKTLCRKYFNADPIVVGDAGVALGIDVLLDQPDEVGADRLVNVIAAHERYGGPLIIIDFGTATTFDVMDAQGNYLGGAIAPGINLSLEALHRAAAKLPRAAVARPNYVIGKNTISAMQSGIYWGYVSLIEGMTRRIADEFGQNMDAIATGGLAHLFADATDAIKTADPDLTLRGLYLIHNRNRKA